MRNNNPSIDPANQDTLGGVFNFILDKYLAINIDDMLPARVVAYDPTPPASVSVQIMMMLLTTSGEKISRAQYAKIPVVYMGGGGFIFYFNLNPGDLGFIKANDRDISLFIQSLQESPPNTDLKHSFSSAVFIPSVLSNYVINAEDEENMVIQNLSGTTKISIGNTKIKIMAPQVEIDSATTLTVTAPITTWTGNLNVIGNITATGSITPFV